MNRFYSHFSLLWSKNDKPIMSYLYAYINDMSTIDLESYFIRITNPAQLTIARIIFSHHFSKKIFPKFYY